MKSFRYGRCLSLLLFSSGLSVSLAVSASIPGKAERTRSERLHKEVDLRAELTGRNLKQMSDDELYVELLTHYQSQDRDGMKRAFGVLLMKHPQSPHADNAVYLMGYSALEKRSYAEALRNFEMLLKRYPASNKAVSAEFAKGIAYKHMKLNDLAQKSFVKVRKKYPGSPESFRAESELKILIKR